MSSANNRDKKTHKNVLVAINGINSEDNMKSVAEWLGNNEMYLSIPVSSIWQWDTAETLGQSRYRSFSHLAKLTALTICFYVEIIRKFENDAWGCIEIDQGGRENKIKTRAMLEGMGLRPIPVYHPFLDGWDYFDYLTEL